MAQIRGLKWVTCGSLYLWNRWYLTEASLNEYLKWQNVNRQHWVWRPRAHSGGEAYCSWEHFNMILLCRPKSRKHKTAAQKSKQNLNVLFHHLHLLNTKLHHLAESYNDSWGYLTLLIRFLFYSPAINKQTKKTCITTKTKSCFHKKKQPCTVSH